MSASLDRTGGALAAAAPFAPALSEWATGRASDPGGLAVGLALGGGALLLRRRFAAGRALASAGLAGALAIAAPRLLLSPAAALVALLLAATAGLALWLPRPDPRRERTRRDRARRARSACWVLLALWALVVSSGAGAHLSVAAGLGVAWLIVAALLVRWLRAAAGARRPRAGLALAAAATLVGVVALPARAVLAAGALPGLALVLVRERVRGRLEPVDSWEPILRDPARLLVASFAVLCGGGGLLLLLPVAATSGTSLGLADALFTAVSAACVTGLIVVDTPTALSPLGQVIVLLLIQLGGLGIMAFSTAALSLLGHRISLRYEGAVSGMLGERDRGRIVHSMKRLVAFTFTTEAVGALVLTILFLRMGDAPLRALWRGVFTAVSAFCNAGFALQSDSLVGYSGHPVVLHAVAALIVLGGLSPAGAAGLVALARGHRATAQAKLVLVATASLLVGGTVLLAALEWGRSLGGLSAVDRIHNAWFQSATLRTAGFNSIDIAAVGPATLALMMVFMFVGGGPGGTAGGVKVTTASALLLAVVAAIRGRESVEIFGRRIPHRSVYRAAAIATLEAGLVLGATVTLLLTQTLTAREAIFEVFSAVGTVGLSVGGTAKLDAVGKTVVMACMFLGRVGPLSAFMILTRRGREPAWRLPEEEIDVG